MSRIFWLIIIVGVLCLLQVRYFAYIAFKKLSYRRTLTKSAVFEGEKANIVETLINKKLTPLPWLRVESLIPRWLKFKSTDNLVISDERFHKSVFYIKGYSKITRTFEVTCTRRGYYDLTRTTLSVGDLFGFNAVGKEYVGKSKLFVYPRILDQDELGTDALKWQGDIAVRRWILPDPILVNGIREYRPGDNQRDIHWKATARTGELQVKTRDFTVSPRVMIVLNTEPEDQFWGNITAAQAESMEGAIRVVATFANWAVHSGIDVGFYSNGQNTLNSEDGLVAIRPNCSEPHLESILQVLAGLVIKQHETIYKTIDRMIEDRISETDILIMSTFWNEPLEWRADHLRSLSNTVTHIIVQRGVIDFENYETEIAV